MRILSVGCGAIGAFFCGRLAQAGHEVDVVLRSDYDAVKANGFQVESIGGDFVFRPARVLRSAAEYVGTPDYLIVTSKVLETVDVVGMIRPAVGAATVIVLIQNGIGIEDAAAAAFPDNELLSGVAYIGATRIGPGHVRHAGAGNLTLGRFGGGASVSCGRLCAAFEAAGVPAQATENIAFYRWKKLLWNLPFNPVSVLGCGLLTAEMTDGAAVEALCVALMRETAAVGRTCGVELPDELVAQQIEFTRKFPPYKTSMLIDFEQKRPLEVEAIVGNALRLARKAGIPVPHMETVYALLKEADRKNRFPPK